MRHRNTIFVESAQIIAHDAYPGAQHILRLHAPKTAAHAEPGSFVHLQCDQHLPMRRPLSIMRCSERDGWVELLYRVFGAGTGRLAQQAVGTTLSLLGPIGRPFRPDPERPRALLIGGGVGIPPMIFLAERMRQQAQQQALVLMGSETPFPFRPRPSQILLPGVPSDVIGAMPLLEDWGVTSRLASQQGFPGCFHGYVTELAALWLEGLDSETRGEVALYACGPHPMLEATAALARRFQLPCQVSMEEFMACAVGGCAGCTLPVRGPDGPAMKRVCVDGPVFDAYAVFA